MPDNETTGSGKAVATDKVTYSGDADQNVQLVRVVQVTGAEGSKTVVNMPGDATDGLLVNLGANNDISGTVTANAGTNLNTSALALESGGNLAGAATSLAVLDDTVFTDDAAYTVGTSKVNMAGAVAVAHGANPDAAEANDAVALLANRHRVLFMLGGHPNLDPAEYYTTAAQTDDQILPAISAGTKYVIMGISVLCSGANTVNVSVRIGFGTSTVPTQGASGNDAVSKVVLSHPGIVPGSGVIKGYGGGIIAIGGDGEELRITNSVPTTGSLVVEVLYFTIQS